MKHAMRIRHTSAIKLEGRGLQHVSLARGDVLETAGASVTDAYFLTSGVCCHTVRFEGRDLMTMVVGKESMTGCSIVLGGGLPSSSATMRTDGKAFKVPRKRLLELCADDSEFQTAVLRLCHERILQLENTISFWATATVIRRLARLILLFAERLDGGRVLTTHDEWAAMLGVRRPGITNALNVLASEGLLRLNRGETTVINVSRLEEFVSG